MLLTQSGTALDEELMDSPQTSPVKPEVVEPDTEEMVECPVEERE